MELPMAVRVIGAEVPPAEPRRLCVGHLAHCTCGEGLDLLLLAMDRPDLESGVLWFEEDFVPV
jgi:hypothetical protein